MTTACETLAARFKKKQREGLLDVKFFLQNREEAVAEGVCGELLSFYEAIDAGKAKLLDFGDLSWREPEEG